MYLFKQEYNKNTLAKLLDLFVLCRNSLGIMRGENPVFYIEQEKQSWKAISTFQKEE